MTDIERQRCERFKEVIKYIINNKYADNKQHFCNVICIKPNTLSGILYHSGISDKLLSRIKLFYPFININWILNGEGNMIDTEVQIEEVQIKTPISLCIDSIQSQINTLQSSLTQLRQLIK